MTAIAPRTDTSVPPGLAGTDGTVHTDDGMPPAVPTKVARDYGWSNSWLAIRVARRLVERHGFPRARRAALQQKAKHITLVNNERHVTDPFKWLFWDLVAIDCAKVPEPLHFQLERAS